MKTLKRWIGGLFFLLTFRPKVTAIAALAAAVLGLGLWGERALTRTVAAEPGYALAKAPFSMTALPAYLAPGILGDLHRAHVAALSGSVVDRDAAAQVGEALASSPWVRRVASVEIDTAPKITVTLEFREPVARVAWGSGAGLVDAEGVLLPRGYYRPEAAAEAPLVVGVRQAPPAKAGGVWKDPGLMAGLEILGRFHSDGVLQASPSAGLATVDVSNAGEKQGDLPEIVCLTRRRLALRFSACGKPGRPDLDEQIGRLHQVLGADPRLSLARNYVDLRFDRPVGS